MDNGNNSTSSIASLICSIVSFFVFPFTFGIAGIILGIIGISKQEEKKNLAVIGVIIGIFSILFTFYAYGG